MMQGLSKSTRTRILAAGLLLPLLGTAAACSTSNSEPQGTPEAAATSSSTASPTTSPTASASAPATGSGAASPTADAGTGQSPAGDAGAEESPATQDPAADAQSPQPAPVPTFNATEESFLEGKVPEGIDPNSVLQAGQERCDLLLSTKALDPEAVISELIMNPLAETTEAINTLCTDLLPELRAAELGFPDGVFAVGEASPHAENPSVAPGTYRSYPGAGECSISVYAGSGSLIGSYDGSASVAIGADAARVESSQCYSWFRT